MGFVYSGHRLRRGNTSSPTVRTSTERAVKEKVSHHNYIRESFLGVNTATLCISPNEGQMARIVMIIRTTFSLGGTMDLGHCFPSSSSNTMFQREESEL